MEIEPNHAGIHNNYAILLADQGRKAEAEEHYTKALEIEPNNANAHNGYAILLADQGRKAEAEGHYRKALEIEPNHTEAHYNYAILLADQGRKAEAEEHYTKALEIEPNNADAHNNYADFLRKNARLYEAETRVRTALRLEPDYPWALATLGDILADEEYFEEAINEYHKALNSPAHKNPSLESEIHNNLGWSYAHLRQEAKARDEFKIAKSLNPMNIKAVRNLRYFDKSTKFPQGLSRIQLCISAVLAILLLSSYALFLVGKISETLFVAQSTVLMAMIIFVLYSDQLARFKMGTLELEMSERSAESRRAAITSKMER